MITKWFNINECLNIFISFEQDVCLGIGGFKTGSYKREYTALKENFKSIAKLAKLSNKYFNQLLELKQDFISNNESRIQGSGALDKYNEIMICMKMIILLQIKQSLQMMGY